TVRRAANASHGGPSARRSGSPAGHRACTRCATCSVSDRSPPGDRTHRFCLHAPPPPPYVGGVRALLALALWLAVVVPSAAEDPCLTGASTLTAQRALAWLRPATDAACPCASFARRRDFQTCARGVIGDALAGGALRAACRRVAIGIAKGAVCGTTRVACGRY